MAETMELLERTESKISKDKNGENVPYLEIIEVVLIRWVSYNSIYLDSFRIEYIPEKSKN